MEVRQQTLTELTNWPQVQALSPTGQLVQQALKSGIMISCSRTFILFWIQHLSMFTIQWITFCAFSFVPCQGGAIAIPQIHRSASERDGRRMGGSMGKPEVLVFRELPNSCSNRRHESRRGFRRFKWRVCDPGWRWLSLSRSIHSRRRLLALWKGWSPRVLLRNELEQGSCDGWANVPTGLGFRPGLLCNKSWRWSQWRGWTLLTGWRSLVLPGWFYVWCFTIWKRQDKILSKYNTQYLSMTIIL